MHAYETKMARWPLLLALLAGNLALALGPAFVRLADTGPVSAGFWRLFLALPFLALFAKASRQPVSGFGRRTMWLVLLAGAVFALDLASWHLGIELTRLGNATLFGNSGSLVLMVSGFVVMHAWPKRREWLAIASALGGVAILLGRSLEISASTLAGDLLCLLAGMFYAGYLIILQGARGRLGNWALLFWASLAGAPVALAIALMLGEPVWPGDWTPILFLVASSQLLGQGLLVFSLRHFPPLVIGLALLTQPAVAAIYGVAFFGEPLSALDIFGMALLGGALVLAKTSDASPPVAAVGLAEDAVLDPESTDGDAAAS